MTFSGKFLGQVEANHTRANDEDSHGLGFTGCGVSRDAAGVCRMEVPRAIFLGL